MGDFYTYLSFIGIVSVWSIYGFIAMLMRSVGGITIYAIGLFFITNIHFIIGFVHILMLFTTYRPILMDSCLQRQPTRFFWWSLGYEETDEMKKIFSACSSQWISFTTERFASWVAYSVVSGIARVDGDWSDDDSYITNEKRKKGSTEKVTYYHEEFPTSKPSDREFSASMYQQRQKLFDEIAKRKRARTNLNRKSIASNTSRDSVLVVHPLDLAQDPDVYRPPPMPPADTSESWNRYNDELLKEDQEAIERQKRVDALSTERLEYEMYRTSGTQQQHIETTSEVIEMGASRRKRPSTSRWSVCYPNMQGLQPLASTEHPVQEEEEEEEEEQQQLVDHLPDENNSYIDYDKEDYNAGEIGYLEEDTYEDYQQEDNLPEDASPSASFLMKPTKEETVYK
ncbi:hypothetical protein HPULCUR_000392 [Helicostylum pulchrum]|uniref:Uncharacterized protein n=1 Tax=Helicostylum pulchrum TaxID=562976 RepID=A0ABP9XJU7_9FUNG